MFQTAILANAHLDLIARLFLFLVVVDIVAVVDKCALHGGDKGGDILTKQKRRDTTRHEKETKSETLIDRDRSTSPTLRFAQLNDRKRLKTMAPILPPLCRGMTVLDRALFTKSLETLALRIPAARTSFYTKLLATFVASFGRIDSSDILDLPKIRKVFPDPQDASKRLILLDMSYSCTSDIRDGLDDSPGRDRSDET
jgi:hypothetical protein